MSLVDRFGRAAVSPEDMLGLQSVFDALCAEEGLDKQSDDGSALALKVISLFQSGLRDMEFLKETLSKRPRQSS